jgi:hypothetical protein
LILLLDDDYFIFPFQYLNIIPFEYPPEEENNPTSSQKGNKLFWRRCIIKIFYMYFVSIVA